jgi:hypothetical protein
MDIPDRGKAERWLGTVAAPTRALREVERVRLFRAAAGKVEEASSGPTTGDIELKPHGSRCREDYSVESGQIDERIVGCERESDPGVAKVD